MMRDKESDYSPNSLAERFFKENKEKILKYIQRRVKNGHYKYSSTQ